MKKAPVGILARGISFNKKCSQIPFFHCKLNLKFNYKINNSDLIVVSKIKDLGFLLSSDLSLNSQINMICNKALRVFCYIQLVTTLNLKTQIA